VVLHLVVVVRGDMAEFRSSYTRARYFARQYREYVFLPMDKQAEPEETVPLLQVVAAVVVAREEVAGSCTCFTITSLEPSIIFKSAQKEEMEELVELQLHIRLATVEPVARLDRFW
jgi:hypothetical protein